MQAQSADLSLAEAVNQALQNHLQIKISDANQAIAQNNNSWEAAGRFPTISLILNSQNSYTNANNPANVALPESISYGTGVNGTLDATWVLFDGFKVRINKQQLELLETQSFGNTNIVVENIMQNVILAYYQAKLAEDQLEVVGEVLTLSADRVAYQELRQDYGQASTFDILQTQDAFLSDSSNYILQQNNFRAAIQNLNRAMGVTDISQTYTLTDQLNGDAPALDLEDLEQRLLNRNNSLQNAAINLELANINTELAESNRAPRISFSTGLSYDLSVDKINGINIFTGEEFGTLTGNTLNAYGNLSASYSIYSGNSRQRAIENAQVQQLMSAWSLEDLQQDLLLQLKLAYDTYNNQTQLVALNEALVENARQNLLISEERFKGGLINSFDYRTIQLSYINANQALLNAIFNLKNTETNLMRLTGDLVR